MKLARFTFPGWDPWSLIDRLLMEQDVEFLHLHDPRPHGGDHAREPDQWLELWKSVHRAMYLRPEIRVLTNATWGEFPAFIESLCELLVECGSAHLPVAVIRGTNLLPNLNDVLLPASNFNIKSAVAAQVEIAAAPLAKALDDGAKIVVVAACDIAAPFIAAASSADYIYATKISDAASLAAASQFDGIVAEIFSDGRVELEQAAVTQLDRVRKLGQVRHADLTCDYTSIALESVSPGRRRIERVVAAAGDDTWEARILLAQGMAAWAIFETNLDVSGLKEFCSERFATHRTSVKEFVPPTPSDSPSHKLFMLEYQGESAADCQAFVQALQWWLNKELGSDVQLFSGVRPVTSVANIRVPVDRIVLSVETRPAREWM